MKTFEFASPDKRFFGTLVVDVGPENKMLDTLSDIQSRYYALFEDRERLAKRVEGLRELVMLGCRHLRHGDQIMVKACEDLASALAADDELAKESP